LLNIVVGMVRILRGPTAADRMLAAEMFATSAVVIVLLMAVVSSNLALIDVALVFALLAALASVTFVSRAWSAIAGGGAGAECADDATEDPR
jgi:multicomponent Na+:H+ antiporter subunit F